MADEEDTQFVRQRQLKDIIMQASVYSDLGLLTNLFKDDESYQHEAATELSVVSTISYQAGVLKLEPLRNNKELWKYFEEHPHLKIFPAYGFSVDDYSFRNGQFELLDVDLLHYLASADAGWKGPLAEVVLNLPIRLRDRLVLWYCSSSK